MPSLLPPFADRPLDTNEWFFAIYNDLGAYLTALAAVVEGPLTESLLREAMLQVQDRHPLLRARIAGGLDAPRWVPASGREVDLRVVDASAGTSLERLAEDHLHRRYDPARSPLWRCTWARASENGPHLVVLGMHHSVADGLSGLTIFSDLIAACGAISQGSPGLEMLPIGLPLDAVRGPPTPAERVRKLLRRTWWGLSRHPSSPPPFEAVAAAERRRTRVVFRELPSDALGTLLARAREERATIAGALTAAFLEAARARLGALERVSLSHPVSLRGTSIPRNQVGSFTGNVATFHRFRHQPPFWELARQASRQLREGVGGAQARLVERWALGEAASAQSGLRRLHADPVRAGREGFLSLSSRGRWPDPSSGPFRVHALYPATSNHGLGNYFQASCGTVGDSLFCSLMYVEPLHSEATGRAVADAFLAALVREAGDANGSVPPGKPATP